MMRLTSLKWLSLLGMILVLGLVVGCSDDDETTPVGPGPGVDEFARVAALGDVYYTAYTTSTGAGVNTTAANVWANMQDGDDTNDYYMLDWRSTTDYDLGHIEGAIDASLGDFANVVAAIPAGRTVLNICYSGQSASHATAYMNMLGIDAVNLKFGMCGWTTDLDDSWENNHGDDYASWLDQVAVSDPTDTYDYPDIDTGLTDPEDILLAQASAYLAAGWKKISVSALYEDMVTNGNADDYFVINYFNEDPYNAGHIPGAFRFQPKQDFRTDEMLSNLPTDKKIVVYCYTGQTSSQVVAYLNALGYDAYSLLFGVNNMCYSNGNICEVQWHTATTDYPVVPTP